MNHPVRDVAMYGQLLLFADRGTRAAQAGAGDFELFREWSDLRTIRTLGTHLLLDEIGIYLSR